MSSTVEAPPSPGRRIGVILGLVAYLAVGFLYLTSGLVVPGVALIVLWLVWLGGMWWVARTVAGWSWRVLAAAPAALAFWWLYLWVGETVFGWTA